PHERRVLYSRRPSATRRKKDFGFSPSASRRIISSTVLRREVTTTAWTMSDRESPSRAQAPSAAALEVLHRLLVLLGGGQRLDGAQVAALAGLGVLLARIEAILTALQLADHDEVSFRCAVVQKTD